jgi:hypothetical protein
MTIVNFRSQGERRQDEFGRMTNTNTTQGTCELGPSLDSPLCLLEGVDAPQKASSVVSGTNAQTEKSLP